MFLSCLIVFGIYGWNVIQQKNSPFNIEGETTSSSSSYLKYQQLEKDAATKNSSTATMEAEATIPSWPPLEPVRIVNEYKQQHSHQTLMKIFEESTSENGSRKFALVPYQCPDRAGNFLHNMFNSMIWSIITNRTILWIYDSPHEQNTVEDCQQVLKRSQWIPSWDEWSLKLNLDDPVPVIWENNLDDQEGEEYQEPQVVVFPQIQDTFHYDEELHSHLERISWRDHPMKRKIDLARIKAMSQNVQDRANALYKEGIDFLLGLLFRQSFELLVEPPDNFNPGWTSIEQEDGVVSIALHSRHPVNGDDGTFLDDEKFCLNQLLTKHYFRRPKHLKWGCQIHLMSDRKATVDILSKYVQTEFNCTPIVASRKISSSIPLEDDSLLEHGPWAGIGFLEDLKAASYARTAIVGSISRSSFMLIDELVDYEQRMLSWRQNKSSTHRLDICKLPQKKLTGYNYGPGTPTFIRHNERPKLEPIQVLKEYKDLHTKTALVEERMDDEDSDGEDDGRPREYVVIEYDAGCCLYSNNSTSSSSSSLDVDSGSYHQFLNQFLFAIITNRTIVVKNETTSFVGDVEEEKVECCLSPAVGNSSLIPEPHEWIPLYNETDEDILELFRDGIDMSHLLSNITDHIVEFSDDIVRMVIESSSSSSFSLSQKEAASDDVIEKLLAEGKDYLYGMLFFEFFHSPDHWGSTPDDYDPDIKFALNTIALYDRVIADDEKEDDHLSSSSKKKEKDATACLETIVDSNLPCHVYVMDDELNNNNEASTKLGIKSLSIIDDWIKERNCTIWKPSDPDGDELYYTDSRESDCHNEEDDDYSRLPFFQLDKFFHDISFLSKAKTAYVGPSSASLVSKHAQKNQILIEWMEYKRRNHIWKDGRFPPLHNPNLTKCIL